MSKNEEEIPIYEPSYGGYMDARTIRIKHPFKFILLLPRPWTFKFEEKKEGSCNFKFWEGLKLFFSLFTSLLKLSFKLIWNQLIDKQYREKAFEAFED